MFDALVMNPNWPDGASDSDMVLAGFPCMNHPGYWAQQRRCRVGVEEARGAQRLGEHLGG